MKHIDPKKLVDVHSGATYLLGCIMKRTLPSGEVLTAKIVETESYHQEDPASHTFRGQTVRNQAMFGKPGHAYIYFTYGMHWCFNVTAAEEGHGAGILIRAAEPLKGIETMQRRRNKQNNKELLNGPAKLAQTFSIDKQLYGHDLLQPPLEIFEPQRRDFKIIRTTRIGIKESVAEIARFYIAGSDFISKP